MCDKRCRLYLSILETPLAQSTKNIRWKIKKIKNSQSQSPKKCKIKDKKINNSGCISLNSQDTSCSVSTTGSSSNNLEQTIIRIGPDAFRQGKYGCWHAVLFLRNIVRWLAFYAVTSKYWDIGCRFPLWQRWTDHQTLCFKNFFYIQVIMIYSCPVNLTF